MTRPARLEFQVARWLDALPPAWQLRLARERPVTIDGLTLDPGLQLLLALRRRRFVRLETLSRPRPGPKVPPGRCPTAHDGVAVDPGRLRHGERAREREPRRGGMTMMTATAQDETTVERLLGAVGETMTGEVVLLAADAPAEAALRRLVHKAISGAPVVDRGRVVGW